MSDVTIYHNPKCGTSRNVLALIRNAGIEPMVIEYLKTPPSRAELVTLIAATGAPLRDAIRAKEAIYTELNLADPALSDDALIDAMLAHPILINRPLVVTPLGTRLCRPSEAVLDLLPAPQQGPFAKEDGEVVIDARDDAPRPDSGKNMNQNSRIPAWNGHWLLLIQDDLAAWRGRGHAALASPGIPQARSARKRGRFLL